MPTQVFLQLDKDLDLANWPDVLSWTAKASAAGASQQEIANAFFSDGSALGNIRAFTHLMRTPGFTKEIGLACLRPAYRATSDELLKIIIATSVHHLGIQRSLLEGEKNSKTSPGGMELLAEYLNDLRSLHRIGILPLEAEYRIYHAMAVTALTLNDAKELERLINRLLVLAEIIGHEELSDRTTNFCITALTNVDSYSRIISLGYPQLQRTPPPSMEDSYESVIANMAHAYLHMGAYRKCKSLFEEGLKKSPDSVQLKNYFLWNQVQAGQLDLSTELPMEWDRIKRYRWQIESFQELGRAMAEGPHRVQRQRQHFLRMVEITNEGIDTRLTRDSTIERWLRARARLGLQEYALALDELRMIQSPNPDDFLYRAWINAIHLELGMTTLPQLIKPMHELEEEARQLYRDVHKVNNADAEGLAYLTARWMPGATAYLGRIPDGIAECRVALEDVFRITSRSRWRMTVLPPPLALSLTLGALGKEHRPSLNANTNFQLRPLREKIGEADVWGPVVAPVSLALGLLRAGHLETAREWLSVTLVAPQVKGEGAELTEQINTLFKQAAEGERSFAALLQALDLLKV
ncbi:hypothetical protein DEIPH_ctg060orf0007 [Deinococcus phoenicis]|uniref:Uncharacterized protein n=2 Tax=Deinococcus phoenicis TaxID=1476583 RepID=A0A016QLJ6_9DEIO|nr:hypothetical protein DEIPH_ctg060orf0007 [Deinococcus phoenicis]